MGGHRRIIYPCNAGKLLPPKPQPMPCWWYTLCVISKRSAYSICQVFRVPTLQYRCFVIYYWITSKLSMYVLTHRWAVA